MFGKMLFRIGISCFSALILALPTHGQFARLVDPFLGASGGGNVFPGPVVPFGMIKPGPDMITGGEQDANAGWDANGEIRGFSQTHVSGTGGGPKYGNILVMPTTGEVSAADAHSRARGREGFRRALFGRARPLRHRRGHYRGSPCGDLPVPLSPECAGQPSLRREHCLLATEKYGESQSVTASEVHVLSPTEVAGIHQRDRRMEQAAQHLHGVLCRAHRHRRHVLGNVAQRHHATRREESAGRSQGPGRRVALPSIRGHTGADEDRHLLCQHRASAANLDAEIPGIRLRSHPRRRRRGVGQALWEASS